MTTQTPIDPGPLVMSEGGFLIVAIDLADGSPDAPDYGEIADMDTSRPDWQGYAAWMVRASDNYQPLVEALTNLERTVGPHLATADAGLPTTVKMTIGEAHKLHNAVRKARTVLAAAQQGESK